MCKYIRTILYCFIISCIIVFLEKSFIDVVPDYGIRLKLLPCVFLGIIFVICFDLFLVYFTSKLFIKYNIKIKDIFNNYIAQYSFFKVISEVIALLLNQCTKNGYILKLPAIIPAITLCWMFNKDYKSMLLSGKRRSIILLIIFILLFI